MLISIVPPHLISLRPSERFPPHPCYSSATIPATRSQHGCRVRLPSRPHGGFRKLSDSPEVKFFQAHLSQYRLLQLSLCGQSFWCLLFQSAVWPVCRQEHATRRPDREKGIYRVHASK